MSKFHQVRISGRAKVEFARVKLVVKSGLTRRTFASPYAIGLEYLQPCTRRAPQYFGAVGGRNEVRAGESVMKIA